MKCKICEKGELEESDNMLICQGIDSCGSVFSLEYFGMCYPGDEEITEDGAEDERFREKYLDRILKFKCGEI